MSIKELERVVYYEDYIVVEPGSTGLTKHQLLNEIEYMEACSMYGDGSFVAKWAPVPFVRLWRRWIAGGYRPRFGRNGSYQKQADQKKTGSPDQAFARFPLLAHPPEWMC
jgi:DNA-directed RNA polymerase beta' subunit